MAKLIALVAVAIMTDGVRTMVQPGEEVIGLNKVDIADLKACGAIEDVAEAQTSQAKDATAEKLAAKEFADARQAVQATQAAIEAPAAKNPPTTKRT